MSNDQTHTIVESIPQPGTLAAVAAEIAAHIERGEGYCREAGKLLLAVRGRVDSFSAFLKEYGIARTTAYRCMRMAGSPEAVADERAKDATRKRRQTVRAPAQPRAWTPPRDPQDQLAAFLELFNAMDAATRAEARKVIANFGDGAAPAAEPAPVVPPGTITVNGQKIRATDLSPSAQRQLATACSSTGNGSDPELSAAQRKREAELADEPAEPAEIIAASDLLLAAAVLDTTGRDPLDIPGFLQRNPVAPAGAVAH